MHRVDLDDLARAYRHRRAGEAGRSRALTSAAGLAGRAIDIGGGTGDYAVELSRAGLDVLVVDVSRPMCAAAARRGVPAVQAAAQDLPIRDDVAALAFFHLSIHYGSWERALDEAVRVVRPGGRVEVWSFSEAGIARSSLARWFPSVVAIDAARFPDPGVIAAHLARSTTAVRIERHDDDVTRKAGDWAEAVRNRFVSTLQFVPDDEIRAGLAEFRRVYPDGDADYRYTLEFQRITAIV